jgi:hypothetical protein
MLPSHAPPQRRTPERRVTSPKTPRVFGISVAAVYPLYLAKVGKKGRSQAELDAVFRWLTGFDDAQLAHHLAAGTTFSSFFEQARLPPAADKVTGVVCGVRVENVDDPLMKKIRILDKLVDELARGRPLDKVIRA